MNKDRSIKHNTARRILVATSDAHTKKQIQVD